MLTARYLQMHQAIFPLHHGAGIPAPSACIACMRTRQELYVRHASGPNPSGQPQPSRFAPTPRPEPRGAARPRLIPGDAVGESGPISPIICRMSPDASADIGPASSADIGPVSADASGDIELLYNELEHFQETPK
jgi:hypothetical protein